MMSGGSPDRELALSQFAHHRFAIGHLRHVLGRNEADRVNVPEAERHEALQILTFSSVGIISGEPLPGIPRAFDYGYVFQCGSVS